MGIAKVVSPPFRIALCGAARYVVCRQDRLLLSLSKVLSSLGWHALLHAPLHIGRTAAVVKSERQSMWLVVLR